MEITWNRADCPICEKQEDLDQSVDLNEFEIKKVSCRRCNSEFELQKTDDNESWYGYETMVKIIKIGKSNEIDNN
jgi:glutaredoxin